MKHTLEFKNANNFGHIIYNMATFEHGENFAQKEGYYSIYVKCSKKQLDALMQKATAFKMKSLKSNINKKQKELIQLCNELATYPNDKFKIDSNSKPQK
jgi:HD superfamily phosphohydrolase YqeK